MAITVTVTPDNDDAYNTIVVGGISSYNAVSLTRNDPDGSIVQVRSAQAIPVGGASTLEFFDFEAPLDRAVTYTCTADGTDTGISGAVTITTDGYTWWLKHVSTATLNTKARIMLPWTDVVRPSKTLSNNNVVGRRNPVIVSDVPGGRQGTLAVSAANLSEITALLNILGTGDVLLLQAPASANFPDLYFWHGDVSEHWAEDQGATFRVYTFPFTEQDSPSDALVATGQNSWLLVTQFGTWQNVLDKRATWLDVLNRPYTDADAI